MTLKKYNKILPKIGANSFIAENAFIIGDVTIGENSSIWYNSTLRGDVAPIKIGSRTNIQDGTVIHTSRYNGGTFIGDDVTVGHMALLHACQLKDFSFIGMSATIMDNAVIESFGFVAAGALISPGKIVKSKELWAGVPAKFIRNLTQKECDHIRESSENYQQLNNDYLNGTD